MPLSIAAPKPRITGIGSKKGFFSQGTRLRLLNFLGFFFSLFLSLLKPLTSMMTLLQVKRASHSPALELDVEIRYVKLQAYQRNELIGFMVIEKITAQRIGMHEKCVRLSIIDAFVQQGCVKAMVRLKAEPGID